MKRSKKLLIALLTATCFTAGAFGIAACGSSNDGALYNLYLEYRDDAGDGAMTYEEWLKATLNNANKPGDKGEQGDPGQAGAPGKDGKSAYDLYKESLPATETPKSLEEWLASLVGATGTAPHIDQTSGNWFVGTIDTGVKAGGQNGADGKGIKYIEMTADGKGLVFTFSDDSKQRLTLPSAMTHVHTYDDEVVTLLPVSGEHDGLGYKTCTDNDCEHIELVVMSCYKVKVTLSDGKTPAAGAVVKLGTVSATADASGYAVFPDVEYGEHKLTAELSGYVQTANISTTASKYKYEVNLAKDVTASKTLDELAKVGDKAEYYLTMTGEEDFMGMYFESVSLTLAVSELSKYKVTLPDGYEMVLFGENSSYEASVRGYDYFIAGANESIEISFEIDTDYSDNKCSFPFTVEKVTPPQPGSIDYPVEFGLDKEVSLTASANTDVYFVFNGLSNRYTFTFGENVKLTRLNADFEATKEVTSGTAMRFGSEYYSTYFKAQATDGKIKFTLAASPLDGEKAKPVTLNKGQSVTIDKDAEVFKETYGVWYKIELSKGTYTLNTTAGNANFMLYDALPASDYDGSELANISTAKYIFAVDAETAKTYYIKATSACTFAIADYNAATDAGYSREFPKDINDGTVNVQKGTEWWYKYTVAQDGLLNVSSPDGASFYVYDVSFKMLFSSRNVKQPEVNNGTVYYINAYTYGGTDVSLAVGVIQKVNKVDYSFDVKDDFGNAISGATVKATLEGEEAVTGTTDAEGKATLNLTPGEWTVVVEDVEGYQNARVVTDIYHTASNTSIVLKKLHNYVITSKTADGTAVKDITVIIQKGEGAGWVTVNSKITDAEGKVSFSLVNDNYRVLIESEEYTLVVSGSNTGIIIMKYTEDQENYNIDITVKVNAASAELKLGENQVTAGTEYTLKVTNDDAFNILSDKIQSMVCHTSSMGDVNVINGGAFNSVFAGFVGVVQADGGVNVDLSTNKNMGGETTYTFTFVFAEDTTVNVVSTL